MKKIISIIILFYSCEVYAQAPQPYNFSGHIIKIIETDTIEPIDYLNQKAAWELSFIGDYKRALLFMDIGYYTVDNGSYLPSGISKTDSLFFLNLKAVSAKDFILEKAKEKQMIRLTFPAPA